MGKSGRRKAATATTGGDSSDTESVSSASTVLSDLSVSQATEHVNSNDFVLEKYTDALYEKRGSTRETALGALIDAFESFVLTSLVEDKFATLSHLFINSIKKGSTKEACLACRATGLLAITLGAGTSVREIMEETVPHLSRVLQSGSDAAKMISVLDSLSLITFIGANDLAETEISMKAIWDVIHPKSGSNVAAPKKPKPLLLAAAISAWSFLLTTVGAWRTSPDTWKEPISFLSTLLEADDRAVRIASGEALVLCFELKLLDVYSSQDGDGAIADDGGSKNQLFLNMQALKAKISGLAYDLSMEAGGKGADKKNLNDQRDLFQKIWDFIKFGASPEELIKISSNHGLLRISSWTELIQLNFLRRYLGRGFLKHAQDNALLHDIFHFSVNKVETLSVKDKKFHRIGEEKWRAQKLNRDRKIAQERKHVMLSNQE